MARILDDCKAAATDLARDILGDPNGKAPPQLAQFYADLEEFDQALHKIAGYGGPRRRPAGIEAVHEAAIIGEWDEGRLVYEDEVARMTRNTVLAVALDVVAQYNRALCIARGIAIGRQEEQPKPVCPGCGGELNPNDYSCANCRMAWVKVPTPPEQPEAKEGGEPQ